MGNKKKKGAKQEENQNNQETSAKSEKRVPINEHDGSFPQAKSKKYFFGAITVFALPLLFILFLVLFLFITQRIYPNIKIAGVDVGLLTKEEASQKVALVLSKRGATLLDLKQQNASLSAQQNFTIDLAKQETAPFADKAISEAFGIGRTKAYLPAEIDLKIKPSIPIRNQIENISSSINQNPIDSDLKIFEGEITVTQSQSGVVLDEDKLYSIVSDYLNGKTLSNSNLPIKTAEPELSYEEATAIKKRLDEIKLSPIKLTFEDLIFSLDLEKTLELIDLANSQNSVILATVGNEKFNIGAIGINGEDTSDSKLTLNPEKLNEYLIDISSQIDRTVQEPLFSVDPNSSPEKPRITEFRPPLEGRQLDKAKAAELISAALIKEGHQNNINLPVNIITPKNSLVNDLGIKELIGTGVSNFAGSIENRKFNVGLAASRINGVIIAPNEEFSFVNTVGDISAATGYKQAYVIKSGRTVLDDGGGVCQVSTTIFRSALNTGLPITARTAHAYRVGYYEQGFPPGIDATIFHPSVDFKFKNDTGHHILIQAYVTGTTLTVDLYGTSDGRTVSMSKPVVGSVTPAPPELRQDDPSLPKGTVKQVDFAANGANVSFSRTVTKGGVTYINETFRSNYRPWQAVYLVGTKDG